MQKIDPLFQEIDEAVQRDQMLALWKQYRKPIVAAIALFVMLTLGLSQWRNYQERQAGLALEKFSAAQDLFKHEQYEAAAAAFAELGAHPASKEAGDMAHLWQGRALVEAKKLPEAITVLQDLAEHAHSKQFIWRDLACLRLVALDSTKTSCLALSGESPLASERKLTQAALLWEQHQFDEARAVLQPLTLDPLASQQVRERAQRYMSVLPAPKPTVTTNPAP